MAAPKSYHWRKASDINREYALFELLEDGEPILDVGFSDAGIFEIAFNPGMAGTLIEWEQFRKMIEEGKRLAELDR